MPLPHFTQIASHNEYWMTDKDYNDMIKRLEIVKRINKIKKIKNKIR